MLKNVHKLFPVLALLFALFLLTRYINIPFVGPNATDGNKLSIIARNYNYWGFLTTKLAPITDVAINIPQNANLYYHHGPLTLVILSLFYKFFGVEFWVGRIPYIIAAFLIFPLLFLIGKEVKNKSFGILNLCVGVLIPAAIVFGRMPHFQSSWSLLFIILTGFLSVKFIKTNNIYFLLLAVISAVLGTLCDWPMTYFLLFLLPLFIKNKRSKYGLLILTSSVITAALILLHINSLQPLTTNLLPSIANRSLGNQLVTVSFWPLKWLGILFVRYFLYFNPLFALISVIYAFSFVKKIKLKKLTNFDLLIFSFFAYGLTYILLYPEGSFSHPFWIYGGLVPFVALSVSEVIFPRLKKNSILLILLFLFSILFSITVESWKTKQNLAEVYRYTLAKQASIYLTPYQNLAVNPDSYIDFDLLAYSFYQTAIPVKPTDNLNSFNHYVYSCIGCDINDPRVNFLAKQFKYKEFIASPAKAYIFFLKEKQTEELKTYTSQNYIAAKTQPQIQLSLFKKAYMFLLFALKVPQI